MSENTTGQGLAIILFFIFIANFIYHHNIVSGIIFLIGSFLTFDLYRRIHKSYSEK